MDRLPAPPLRFDAPVPVDGYRWWYLDGVSDDGRHQIVLIAFVGSVFSPYYAAARRKGPAAPTDHVALNVALYGVTRRWCLTERSARALRRSAAAFAVGPSRLTLDGAGVVAEINERDMPTLRPVMGTVRFTPEQRIDTAMALDGRGRHRWQPWAPLGRIHVALAHPRLSWSGHGYLDTNEGDEPLEAGFRRWFWARVRRGDAARIVYEALERSGRERSIALEVDASGWRERTRPPLQRLPGTLWRVPRIMPWEAQPALAATLEDAPFYNRSLVTAPWDGAAAEGVQESLDLDRFSSRLVQALLPFRMPRLA